MGVKCGTEEGTEGQISPPSVQCCRLNTLSSNNELITFNFADDSTLLVPGNSDVNATMEFNYIQDWAKHRENCFLVVHSHDDDIRQIAFASELCHELLI